MSTEVLPETAAVYWRPRVDERSLTRRGRVWTLTTVAHTIPFCVAAIVLFMLNPVSLPVGLILLVHAWAIPELYAQRGANVLKPKRRGEPRTGARRRWGSSATSSATTRASCSPAPGS